MEILAIIPGLLRVLYAENAGQFLLGLTLPVGFLLLYILCAPLAVILHLWNAAEEVLLLP